MIVSVLILFLYYINLIYKLGFSLFDRSIESSCRIVYFLNSVVVHVENVS